MMKARKWPSTWNNSNWGRVVKDKQKTEIPVEIQLKEVCSCNAHTTYECLHKYLPTLKPWRMWFESFQKFQSRVSSNFTFTNPQLIEYLEKHPEICKDVFDSSSDKRYSPATFMSIKQGLYLVGLHTYKNENVRKFSKFHEAIADYVLYSWNLPRLSAEEADWESNIYIE
jgi:hypothetical protein